MAADVNGELNGSAKWPLVCVCVCVCVNAASPSRQERSVLRAGAEQRPAADAHRVQEPQPRVEQGLHLVSLRSSPSLRLDRNVCRRFVFHVKSCTQLFIHLLNKKNKKMQNCDYHQGTLHGCQATPV